MISSELEYLAEAQGLEAQARTHVNWGMVEKYDCYFSEQAIGGCIGYLSCLRTEVTQGPFI